ncbi:hypothetical protein [uncultured Campylobacter sp.]|nr:hypothetical protein [uncultured Campylobacter sp.]
MPGISTPQELSELLELQNIYILDDAKSAFSLAARGTWSMV